jgi:hypothetical protein
LLATSVPEYELHMDMLAGGIAVDSIFNDNIDLLATNSIACMATERHANMPGCFVMPVKIIALPVVTPQGKLTRN